jgi:hypothetical protein
MVQQESQDREPKASLSWAIALNTQSNPFLFRWLASISRPASCCSLLSCLLVAFRKDRKESSFNINKFGCPRDVRFRRSYFAAERSSSRSVFVLSTFDRDLEVPVNECSILCLWCVSLLLPVLSFLFCPVLHMYDRTVQ